MGTLFCHRGYRHLCTLVLEVERNVMQSLSAFLLIFGDKKPLDFYPTIIEFRIEEKIHTKAVVDVSRGAGGKVFLFFFGRDWEGVSRNLSSLVKLYQRI